MTPPSKRKNRRKAAAFGGKNILIPFTRPFFLIRDFAKQAEFSHFFNRFASVCRVIFV
jgi:hypothetical protein